jgi:hypothetical protein
MTDGADPIGWAGEDAVMVVSADGRVRIYPVGGEPFELPEGAVPLAARPSANRP